MADMEKKSRSHRPDVETGDDPSRASASKLAITIKKGHVRRAMRAADIVYSHAKDPASGDIEEGVTLLTALLLVERLAATRNCDPNVVLDRLAECFELKRRYQVAPWGSN